MYRSKVILLAFNYKNHFSLANGYLKAYAEKDPFIRDTASIQLLDFDAEQHDIRQVLYYLAKEQPDIVGFSCYCWNMDKILNLTRCLKQLYPGVKIILGGPEVGPAAQKYMMENPAIDTVVVGEGEVTFQELLRSYVGALTPLARVKGIVYREHDRLVSTETRPPCAHLEDIPSPYLTGILKPRDEVTYIETYRGCPYRCAFCYEGKNFPELRFFPEERVKKEIELIMSIPAIRSFHIVDSVFNLKKERLKRLAQIFFDANKFGTGLRTVEVMAESIDEETVTLLKKANVLSVETGPQTVNENTLRIINRYFEKEKFQRGIALLVKGGIEVLIDLIIGLPGDNFFRFATSIKTLMPLNPTTLVFSALHVLPGTDLYTESHKLGLQFDEKAPHLVLQNSTFPYEELDKAVVMAVSVGKEYNLKLP